MTERRVLWTRTARRDLDAIIDEIADNALSILERLSERAASLGQTAERGRLVPEPRVIGVTPYRELIERPWRLLYRIESERVMVLAVLDGRRDLDALLLERLVRS